MAEKSRAWQKTALALATASFLGLGSSAPALALTLGPIEVLSRLGEPLLAEIDLPDITDDESTSFKAALAPPEDFRAAGLTYQPGLNNLQVTLGVRDERVVLQLRGATPLSSPYVDLVLQAQWAAGRVVRNYTVLLTPAPPAAQASGPAPMLPDTGTTPAAPAASAVPQALPAAAGKADGSAAVKDAGTARVTVKYGDTAGRIAAAHLPPAVSLDQMLIALLRANPDAFVNGNVNRLKAGAVLDLPNAQQAQATDAQQAQRMVRAQSRDFNEYRRKLAGLPTPTPPKAAQRQAGGRIESQIEDKKAPAATADKLTLSKGATKGRTREDDISRQANRKEAERQADALSKNIEELKKLSAAITQAASAPASSAPPAAVASAPASSPLAMTAPVALPASAAMAPASAPASAPAAPASAASEPVAPASAPMAGSPLIDTLVGMPWLPWAGAGLLALLALLGVYRARRRSGDDGGAFQQALQASMSPPPTDAEPAAPAPAPASQADPLAEAVAFLAYGREQQAVDILHAGLAQQPERLALHAKLLEIYAKRQEAANFENIARRVHQLTGGAGEYWDHACELGIEIDPDNPLYHRSQAAAIMPPPQEPPAAEPLVEAELAAPAVEVPAPEVFEQEPASAPAMAIEVEVPGEPAAQEPELTPADLDLDLPTQSTARPAAAPEPAAFDLNSINLDLGAPQESAAIPDDPLSIKMALAEEFSAIGDTDGARSLLEEVIAEASGDLRAQAEEALKKLG